MKAYFQIRRSSARNVSIALYQSTSCANSFSKNHHISPPHNPPLKHVPYLSTLHLPWPPRRLRRLCHRHHPHGRQPHLLHRNLPDTRHIPCPHRPVRKVPCRCRLRRATRLSGRRIWRYRTPGTGERASRERAHPARSRQCCDHHFPGRRTCAQV